jgi:hypothetical protein
MNFWVKCVLVLVLAPNIIERIRSIFLAVPTGLSSNVSNCVSLPDIVVTYNKNLYVTHTFVSQYKNVLKKKFSIFKN